MKKIIRNIKPFFLTSLFGMFAIFLTSASIPSGNVPVPTSDVALNPATSFRAIRSTAPLSALLSPNADTLTRISFAAGTTSGSVTGSLSSQATQSYILDAAWNQVMLVTVTSPGNNVYLEINGVSDGIFLTRFSNSATSWQGWLPGTESYIVKVFNNGGSTANYTLNVEIPARIRFALGAYSGSVFGWGSAAKTISYVLYAFSGQTMTATLSSSTGSVYLSIQGFSGGQSLVASSAALNTWTGTLPQSQEYIIRAVQNGSFVDFTLTVTIV
jgi:hypothetical protein